MRIAATLVATASLALAGCFQSTTILKVNGDGSGTIEETTIVTHAGMAQLKQIAPIGGDGQGFDMFTEQQARSMAAAIGPTVTYVSSEPLQTADGEGRGAVYAFPDITQVRINLRPQSGVIVRAPGAPGDEAVTFAFAEAADGRDRLVIHVPPVPAIPMAGQRRAPAPTAPDAAPSRQAPSAAQLAMLTNLLAGAKVRIAVEPGGTLLTTDSPYSDGKQVTLFAVDFDKMTDPTALMRLQSARPDDRPDIPGLQATFGRDITIDFAPAK